MRIITLRTATSSTAITAPLFIAIATILLLQFAAFDDNNNACCCSSAFELTSFSRRSSPLGTNHNGPRLLLLRDRHNRVAPPTNPLASSSRSPLTSTRTTTISSSTTKAASSSSSSESGVVLRGLRDRLRRATGFSFTLFRATLRAATGVSLTALYAGAVAATGLWIRQIMSALLKLFPSGMRYFLQPFLVAYYAPLVAFRTLTPRVGGSRARKNARAKHRTALDTWKRDVLRAVERAEQKNYWPIVVGEDGHFELNKPPSIDGVRFAKREDENDGDAGRRSSGNYEKQRGEDNDKRMMADAMAAAVEKAMEVNNNNNGNEKDSALSSVGIGK